MMLVEKAMGYYDKKAKESAETVPILRDWLLLTFLIAAAVYGLRGIIVFLTSG